MPNRGPNRGLNRGPNRGPDREPNKEPNQGPKGGRGQPGILSPDKFSPYHLNITAALKGKS